MKAAIAEASKGRKLITALICRPIPANDQDSAAGEIKKIFQSLGFIPSRVYLNIPRHLVTARFLKIPSVDDQEIKKIIGIESMKHLPYTDERIVFGYRIIEKLDDGYSKVLLVIAQADVVNNYIQILNKAGVGGTKYFSLSSESLFCWYGLAAKREGKENLMIVNLGLDHLNIDIIEGEKLVFTRGVTYGANDPREIEKIVQQVKISINTYQKESDRAVDRVILTGGSSETAGCKLALSKESRIPVDIIDQAKNIAIDEKVIIPPDGGSFAELFALSLRAGEIRINLLPEDAAEEGRLVRLKDNLITAVILASILLALLFGLLMKKMHDKYVYLSRINAELKKIDPKIARAKKMMKDIGVTRDIMNRKPLAVDVLTEVCGVNPVGVALTTLDFESEKALTVRGTAPSLGDVLKYATILESSPYFEGVKVKYANKRTSENKEITDFEINALLTVSK